MDHHVETFLKIQLVPKNITKNGVILLLNHHNLSYPTQTPFCHDTNLALCLITVDDNMKGKQVQIRIHIHFK